MGTTRRGLIEWKALVHEHERSELTIKEFCRRREIDYWTFREWRRRLVDEQPESELVEIATVDQACAGDGSLLLTLGPVTIEIDAPVEAANSVPVRSQMSRTPTCLPDCRSLLLWKPQLPSVSVCQTKSPMQYSSRMR